MVGELWARDARSEIHKLQNNPTKQFLLFSLNTQGNGS